MNIRRIIAVSTVTIVSLFPMSAAAASTPTATINPANSNVARGSHVKLVVRLNPNGVNLNTVNVVINFPADKLRFNGLDKSGSAFSTIIPAEPSASTGKLTFAAANMSSTPVTSDAVVAGLNFTATADAGTAQVSLDGTQAANGGPAIAVATVPASLSFASGSASSSKAAITDIKVTSLTMTGGTLTWHTSQPSNSTVDYGINNKYGFSDTNADVTTAHTVRLTNSFHGKTTVHYKLSSSSVEGQLVSSSDKIFTTRGYTVNLTVNDQANQPLPNAKVQVAGLPVAKTAANGRVTIHDVAPGSQSVTINGGPSQLVSVKAATGNDAGKAQSFQLTARKQRSPFVFLASVGLIGLAGLLALEVMMVARRKRRP